MPYYCTVPRCTSMAGKAKNVSFHQFPRDEELASLWNKILKRGKPYTKYSKVCSLHFRPEDYTITSVGKNKGQWRTLRKDAIPSQNLPSESPVPTPHRGRSSGPWLPSHVPTVIDPMMQQQMAQAIYMQTMLAMQAANNGTPLPTQNISPKLPTDLNSAHTSNITISEIEQILQRNLPRNSLEILQRNEQENEMKQENSSFKCQECSKCFKDPDVFILHRRTHTKTNERLPNLTVVNEKENLNSNSDLTKQETLRANPILANLLKSSISPTNGASESSNVFNTNNILSIENQIMTALAANLESYIRNLSSIMAQPKENDDSSNSNYNDDNCHNSDSLQEEESFVNDSCQNEQKSDNCQNEAIDNCQVKEMVEENCQTENKDDNLKENEKEGSENVDLEPNCDKEDLNESKDSNNLVIDENNDYFPLHLHKKEIDQKH